MAYNDVESRLIEIIQRHTKRAAAPSTPSHDAACQISGSHHHITIHIHNHFTRLADSTSGATEPIHTEGEHA